jgi:hypothetical protein
VVVEAQPAPQDVDVVGLRVVVRREDGAQVEPVDVQVGVLRVPEHVGDGDGRRERLPAHPCVCRSKFGRGGFGCSNAAVLLGSEQGTGQEA